MTTARQGLRFVHHLLQQYFAAEAPLRRFAAGQDLSASAAAHALHAEGDATRAVWERDSAAAAPAHVWNTRTTWLLSLYPRVDSGGDRGQPGAGRGVRGGALGRLE